MLTEQPDKATIPHTFLSMRINLYLLKQETWALNTLHVDKLKKNNKKLIAVDAWKKKILLPYKSSGLLLANHLLVELKHCRRYLFFIFRVRYLRFAQWPLFIISRGPGPERTAEVSTVVEKITSPDLEFERGQGSCFYRPHTRSFTKDLIKYNYRQAE